MVSYPSLTSCYQAQLGQDLVKDAAQQEAVERLDVLLAHLAAAKPQHHLKGVYLWGDVGRGKTFLMDLFFDLVPQADKRRLHFHHFMAQVHDELTRHVGQSDPLIYIADQLATQCRVLCFDELYVEDIADAMILGRLLGRLLERGVVLVATSNLPVSKLYWNGLQRERFFPAIALLQEHMDTVHMAGSVDHRLHLTDQHRCFFLTGEVDFDELFVSLSPESTQRQVAFELCGRPLLAERLGERIIWLSFATLCGGPRSQRDYIELACRFDTVLVSGLFAMGGQAVNRIKARGTEDGSHGSTATGERQVAYSLHDDTARRFISLVDELYDRRVRLYLLSEVAAEALYEEGRLQFEFRRTQSRLVEMASSRYLNS